MSTRVSQTQAPRSVKFDPVLAEAVAERLARGLHPTLIAMQLKAMADEVVVAAYVREAEKNPFFRGAMAQADALKKRDWILEVQRKSWQIQEHPREIERTGPLAPEDFRKLYYANQRPVIITGLVDDWPAMNRWGPDYFDARIGADTLVEVQKGRSKLSSFEENKVRLAKKVELREVTNALRSDNQSNDLYMTAYNGAENRAALDPIWTDFPPIPGYIDTSGEAGGFLWIGPAGTITPFHHDLTNNLLIQVKGRKRVHMVPNWEESRMRTRKAWFSDWTLEDMKAAGDKAPLIMETVIEPGDALFIPVGWWHHIESLDVSYSVLFTNFTWANDFTNAFMSGQ
ncbi:MAG: cupin-like domain-containing protein [Pseudomonadota bacterium]